MSGHKLAHRPSHLWRCQNFKFEHEGIEKLLKNCHAAILTETNVRVSFREGGMKKTQTLQTLAIPFACPTQHRQTRFACWMWRARSLTQPSSRSGHGWTNLAHGTRSMPISRLAPSSPPVTLMVIGNG